MVNNILKKRNKYIFKNSNKIFLKNKRHHLRIGDEIVVRYRLKGVYLTFYGILYKISKKMDKNSVLFLKKWYSGMNTLVRFRIHVTANSSPNRCVEVLKFNKIKFIKFKTQLNNI